MTPQNPNIAVLETVVAALGDLRNELVLVGGCSVGLLITDPASPPVRETIDVDLVAEVTTLIEYYALRERLIQCGFRESSQSVHLCRWVRGALMLDVMPSTEVLGHSVNRWYQQTVRTANYLNLPNGLKIKIISPPLFIATKLEAFYERGNGDYMSSHDIEDIINVFDGRPELSDEVVVAPDDVRSYLRNEFDELLADENFVDAVPIHLRGDAVSQARFPIILERMRRVAGL